MKLKSNAAFASIKIPLSKIPLSLAPCSEASASSGVLLSDTPTPRGMILSAASKKSSQVKLILSPKQRAKPAASRTRTCTNSAVCIASGECPSRF